MTMRIYFATDIHGSEVCWRKFLNAARFYQADKLILGGDDNASFDVSTVGPQDVAPFGGIIQK